MKSTTPVGGVFATVPRVPRTSSPTLAKATQLLLRDTNGGIAQQWLLKQAKSTLGSSPNCAIQCTLPGIAPLQALIVTGSQQTFVRALAPHLTQDGIPATELLLNAQHAYFELAGHRFELVYANRVHQPTQPRKERLRFALTRPLSLGGPSGTASPSPTDQTEPSPAEAAWVSQLIRRTLEPLETQIESLLQPIAEFQSQAVQTHAQQHESQTQTAAAASEEIAGIVARQSATMEVLSERLREVNHQLSTIERIIADDAEADSETAQVVNEEVHVQRTAIEQLQNGMVAVTESLNQLHDRQQSTQVENERWKSEVQRQLEQLAVLVSEINQRGTSASDADLLSAVQSLQQTHQLAQQELQHWQDRVQHQLASIERQLGQPTTHRDDRRIENLAWPGTKDEWSAASNPSRVDHAAGSADSTATFDQPRATWESEPAAELPSPEAQSSVDDDRPSNDLSYGSTSLAIATDDAADELIPELVAADPVLTNGEPDEPPLAGETQRALVENYVPGQASIEASEEAQVDGWGHTLVVERPVSRDSDNLDLASGSEAWGTADWQDRSATDGRADHWLDEGPGDSAWQLSPTDRQEVEVTNEAEELDAKIPPPADLLQADEPALPSWWTDEQSAESAQAKEPASIAPVDQAASADAWTPEVEQVQPPIPEAFPPSRPAPWPQPHQPAAESLVDHSPNRLHLAEAPQSPLTDGTDTEVAVDEPTVDEPAEYPDLADRQAAAISGSTPATNSSSEGSNSSDVDEETSVEEYMRQLLARMRGNDPTPAPRPAPVLQSSQQAVAEPTPLEAISASPPQELRRPSAERFDLETYVPTAVAPEKSQSISAFRDLANVSARSAIQQSSRKRYISTALFKLAICVVGLTVAGVLFAINGLTLNIGLVATLASLMVAFIWGYDGMVSLKPMFQSSLILMPPDSLETGCKES